MEALSPSPLGPFPTFFPGKVPGQSSFDYYFQFEIAAPNLNVSATYNFNPAGAVASFSGDVHAAISCSAGSCTLGDDVAEFTASSATELTLATTRLAPGLYVYHFHGTSNSVSTALSGQTSASPVPAPGVLSLLALGMLGLGASARRRV